MPTDSLFSLTDAQTERLLACRAAWEEGEDEESLERLRRREEDTETLRAVAALVAETHFAEGGDLTYAQTAHLLTLVRSLAPNPNLDSRLLRRPGEPEALNRDLRDLLFGAPSMPARLRAFLSRRHVGTQTALQLLCAVFPNEWPLVTQAGLRILEVSPEQRAAALREARVRFDLPEPPKEGKPDGLPDNAPILRLFADVTIYAAVRAVLEASDYLAVHRLLTQGLAVRPRRGKRSAALLSYASRPAAFPTIVRELPPEYHAPVEDEFATEPLASPPDIAGIKTADVLALLERFVAAQRFTYPTLTVRDYFISLQTKPFVVLEGITGTGKTRLTSLFAEALTENAEKQYRLLPVRPDWADSAPLVGYVNLLAGGGEGRFVSTPFLDFLRRAERPENARRVFFLCLDEMNLARVEHYFAEVLSAMETPTRELLLPNGQSLRLPANLFITGTLNFDESTYSLSRKVLDRANTIAFNEVYLHENPAETVAPASPEEQALTPAVRQAVFLHRRVNTVAAARARLRVVGPKGEDYGARIVNALVEVNALLQPHGLHFAYRVRDEILRYAANSFDGDGTGLLVPESPDDRDANLRTALDLQLLQKVLPRFTGTREQIETPLRDLLRWAEKSAFPRTSGKLARLLARLQRDGFVSFDEA